MSNSGSNAKSAETYGPMTCRHCRHYHVETCSCHAHPPVYALSQHHEPYGAWPPVEPGNFCGEFKAWPEGNFGEALTEMLESEIVDAKNRISEYSLTLRNVRLFILAWIPDDMNPMQEQFAKMLREINNVLESEEEENFQAQMAEIKCGTCIHQKTYREAGDVEIKTD